MIVIDPLQQTDTINTSQKLRIRFKWTYFKGVLAGIRLFRHFIALLVYEDISISMKNWNCLFVGLLHRLWPKFTSSSVLWASKYQTDEWRETLSQWFVWLCVTSSQHFSAPLACIFSVPKIVPIQPPKEHFSAPRIRHFLSPSIPSIPQ